MLWVCRLRVLGFGALSAFWCRVQGLGVLRGLTGFLCRVCRLRVLDDFGLLSLGFAVRGEGFRVHRGCADHTYSLHCNSFFGGFNQFYIKDPKR